MTPISPPRSSGGRNHVLPWLTRPLPTISYVMQQHPPPACSCLLLGSPPASSDGFHVVIHRGRFPKGFLFLACSLFTHLPSPPPPPRAFHPTAAILSQLLNTVLCRSTPSPFNRLSSCIRSLTRLSFSRRFLTPCSCTQNKQEGVRGSPVDPGLPSS